MNRFTGHDLDCIRGERLVFTGLRFELAQGEALVLVGANGSGKSSLLRLMAGFLRPARGELRWNGASLSEDPEGHRARICYVGHLDAVKPVLTVAENLGFWAELWGGGLESVGPALRAFGVDHLADVPGRFLSAGQKRRVNLARMAVSRTAALWLLDEPTTALDRAGVAALGKVLAAHRGRGGMAVVATHSELPLDGSKLLDLGYFAMAEVPV